MSDYIQIAAPHLAGNESKYVAECMDTTWISSAGRFIGEFEERFAVFCEAEHVIATNNGTTALHLALTALGIGPGDEVIVPTLTYIATANAVTYCGAKPVLVDSDAVTLTIDPDDIRSKISSRTKAIIPVHLYGQPANMTELAVIADEYGIALVEDAAEAHGARVGGKRVGGLGTCGTFSFFGNKIITTGEGGAVVTNDGDLAARLRLLRGQGMDPQRRYWFPVVGFNYRMTNIAAAIGLAQLETIETKLSIRSDIADQYREHLADHELIGLPRDAPWGEPVNWIFTVELDVASSEQRDEVGRRLAGDGIETRPVFYPMHQMPPYADPSGSYPIADRCAARGISLPTHTQLVASDIARVCERLSVHVRAVAGDRQ